MPVIHRHSCHWQHGVQRATHYNRSPAWLVCGIQNQPCPPSLQCVHCGKPHTAQHQPAGPVILRHPNQWRVAALSSDFKACRSQHTESPTQPRQHPPVCILAVGSPTCGLRTGSPPAAHLQGWPTLSSGRVTIHCRESALFMRSPADACRVITASGDSEWSCCEQACAGSRSRTCSILWKE